MGKIWKCEKRLFKDHWIKNIRSTHKLQITDGSVPGLYMRYSPTTKLVTFFLACLIRSTGERKNIYLGRYTEYETVEDVKKKARGLREQILLGGNPMAQIKEEVKKQVIKESKKHTYKELFRMYITKYAKVYKKERTVKSNEDQSRLYIEPILGDMYVDEIEEQHVLDAYPVWVEKTSFSTANKVLSLLSSFWDWCESYKYLPRDSNPCKYVRKGKTQTVCKKTTLDIDGYKGLFAALERGPIETDMHEKYFRIIKLLALTGCRSSEIRCLKVREVDLEHKVLHLEDSKTGARDVKLPDLAIKELEIALAEAKMIGSEYVFASRGNIFQGVQDIRKPFQWALKKAGLPQMRIHDLRHSFITMGANTGQNMVAMRDAAGHSRITTTEGYTHLADEQTFIAVNNIANAICA